MLRSMRTGRAQDVPGQSAMLHCCCCAWLLRVMVLIAMVCAIRTRARRVGPIHQYVFTADVLWILLSVCRYAHVCVCACVILYARRDDRAMGASDDDDDGTYIFWAGPGRVCVCIAWWQTNRALRNNFEYHFCRINGMQRGTGEVVLMCDRQDTHALIV